MQDIYVLQEELFFKKKNGKRWGRGVGIRRGIREEKIDHMMGNMGGSREEPLGPFIPIIETLLQPFSFTSKSLMLL